MSVKETLTAKLEAVLNPLRLEIIDESHLHAGHAGARPEGESHFRVIIESAAFTGMSRLERQRLVYGAVQQELDGPVHALSVVARAPGEA